MIFVASVQCKTKFKIEVNIMPLQMNSFDWKWRECLLAVSVTKRMVKFFDNERQFLPAVAGLHVAVSFNLPSKFKPVNLVNSLDQ